MTGLSTQKSHKTPEANFVQQKGHKSTAWLDDSLLLGSTETECIENIQDTLKLLQKLGFVVHPTKSVLRPSKKIQYLGVVVGTESMTVTLTADMG